MAWFSRNGSKVGRLICCAIVVVSLVLPFISIREVHATTTYHIAASDSSAPDKAAADAVCIGSGDQSTINTYLTAGNIVELYAGTYHIDGLILLAANSRLTGQGNTSVLNLEGAGTPQVLVGSVSSVELDNFKITGQGNGDTAVLIIGQTASISNIYVHDVYCDALGVTDYTVYAGSTRTVSSVKFVRVTAHDPDGNGFVLNGAGTSPLIQDVTFYQCTGTGAGVAVTRLFQGDGFWEQNYDLAEYHNMTFNRVNVINSVADGSWEDAIHMELLPVKTKFVLLDNKTLSNAGQKGAGSLYGNAVTAALKAANSDSLILSGNNGTGNFLGDIAVWDEVALHYDYTAFPSEMKVDPAGTISSFSRVTQGNCVGISITVDSTHKELVLYSSDNAVVNQYIELGGYYSADDGGSYTFSGTQILASFTDFAVIRLVGKSLTSLAVTPDPPSHLKVGSTQQFTATGTFSDFTNGNLTSSVTWVSSNTSVATISSGGLATGVAAGNTLISANMSGIFSSNVTLTVKALASIAVTPNPSTNLAIGSDEQFTATGNYTDNSTEVITSSSSWVSSNTTVASITAGGGLAHGLVAGTTNISASKSGITSANVSLLVLTPTATLVSIAVTPASPPTILTGETQQFVATGTYNDNSTAIITSSVAWLSSDATRAYINGSGLATGMATGSTTITASLAGVTSPGVTLSVLAYGSGGLTSGSKFAQDIFPMVVVLAPVLLAFKLVDTGEGGPLTGLIVFGVMVTIAVAFLTVIAPILNGL